MSSEYYYIENDMPIIKASIKELSVCTRDCDEHGYLINNGTNRSMACGFGPDGSLQIWVETNGDPHILYDDDHEHNLGVIESMGDTDEDEDDRVSTGFAQWRTAIAEARALYPDAGAEIAESLEWYEYQIGRVEDNLD